ncbi:MAG: hypothetical protein R2706_15495 [Acidimicrobiales bacterium]
MFAWMGDEPAFMPSIPSPTRSQDFILPMRRWQRSIGCAVTGEGDFVEVQWPEALATFNLVEHLNGHTFVPPQEPFSTSGS